MEQNENKKRSLRTGLRQKEQDNNEMGEKALF
jgi:hypothetical protein